MALVAQQLFSEHNPTDSANVLFFLPPFQCIFYTQTLCSTHPPSQTPWRRLSLSLNPYPCSQLVQSHYPLFAGYVDVCMRQLLEADFSVQRQHHCKSLSFPIRFKRPKVAHVRGSIGFSVATPLPQHDWSCANRVLVEAHLHHHHHHYCHYHNARVTLTRAH